MTLRMMMTLVMTGFVAGCSAGEKGEAGHASVAVGAAEQWLVLVDTEDYEASWKGASAYFQAAVDQPDWEQALRAARGPLGPVVSRTLKSSTHTTSLPGAPDGEYVVIQYDTQFENKAAAVETVTPMLEDDGVWRVSGYYVR